jgi:hypothetical protein
VRVIAGAARDAADCRVLLEMLGIDSSAVVAARGTRKPARGPKTRGPKSATSKAGTRKRRVSAA